LVRRDWDGVNYYEQQRATKLSGRGYVAFAADIYGADLQENLTMDQRLELSSTYRENPNLFIQRIKRALEVMQTNFDFVDPENIAVIGYCFGGTGVIQLAFSGDPTAKVVVSFHGGLAELPTVTTSIVPYTLM
jgi:dienelactone hydrolase